MQIERNPANRGNGETYLNCKTRVLCANYVKKDPNQNRLFCMKKGTCGFFMIKWKNQAPRVINTDVVMLC